MSDFIVPELRLGKIVSLGPEGVSSGINKQPVTGPVMARTGGLEGDHQGDTRHHGGADKALHAYPVSHYPLWARDLPEREPCFHPGGFGENLVIDGANEADICLFDRFRLGGALLEVSQMRQPCWKLNLRFDQPDMARRVQETGRTGWYFRVIEEGEITSGDRAELVERSAADWSLTRVWRLLYRDTMDRIALAEFATLDGLPESWRRMIEARLARGTMEDWRPRLETPQ